MMKRMLLITLVGMFCFAGNLNAINPYQSVRNRVIGFGEALEKIDNIPLVGKFTNLLPVAMVAACLQKCPGQTMIIFAGLLVYVLAQNESIRLALNEHVFMGQKNNQASSIESDDNLFIFDGEDNEEAQEENDTEDELLGEDLLDEEYDDQKNNKPLVKQSSIKFL